MVFYNVTVISLGNILFELHYMNTKALLSSFFFGNERCDETLSLVTKSHCDKIDSLNNAYVCVVVNCGAYRSAKF